MCSDGTIYRYAAIKEGDVLGPLTAAGAEFVTTDRTTSFVLPCPAFKGGCCSIYQTRPSICSEYRCFLLRRYEAGEISFEEAQALIRKTMAQRDRVRPALTAIAEPKSSEALSGLYRLLFAKLDAMPDPAQARRDNAELLLDIAALRVLLSREFEPREPDEPAPADPDGKLDRALGD
jgi:Fe-S-cluster containining protein